MVYYHTDDSTDDLTVLYWRAALSEHVRNYDSIPLLASVSLIPTKDPLCEAFKSSGFQNLNWPKIKAYIILSLKELQRESTYTQRKILFLKINAIKKRLPSVDLIQKFK